MPHAIALLKHAGPITGLAFSRTCYIRCMNSVDAIGRATFGHIEYRRGIRPTPREIRWLKFIERHGPQSSEYLHALTSDTHCDPDTARRQLQKLRAGQFLFCPRQQRATAHASFNPYIYDLTVRAREFLIDHGFAENAIRPSGHWVHAYMTGCITASIDIAARRAGVSYIPGHRVLERSGATLAIDIDGRRLIPDQLFGLDYGGRYRFFCVEADRGTEPKTSSAARKSYRLTIEHYARLIGEQRYRDHYGLKSGLLLLAVFSSKINERRFLDLAAGTLGTRAAWILTQTIPGFHDGFRPPQLLTGLFSAPWQRAAHEPMRIDHAYADP